MRTIQLFLFFTIFFIYSIPQNILANGGLLILESGKSHPAEKITSAINDTIHNYWGLSSSSDTIVGNLHIRGSSYRNDTLSFNLFFKDVHFKGDFEISDYIYYGRLGFDNCTFDGAFIFNNNVMDIFPLISYNSNFNNRVEIQNTTFPKGAFFEVDTFSAGALINKNSFEESSSFIHSTFWGNTDFDIINFNQSVNFDSAAFLGNVDFSISTFNGLAWFKNAAFNNVSFQNVSFNSKAEFGDINVGNIRLYEVNFNQIAKFSNAHFNGTTKIIYTYFNKIADFSDAVFSPNTYIENISFSPALIDFNQISKKIHPLPGNINYYNYSKIYIPFINNFRLLGKNSEANDCYYELRNIERKLAWDNYINSLNMNPLSWIKPFWLEILRLTCGYGVKPKRPIILGILIISIFNLAFCKLGAIKKKDSTDYYNSLIDIRSFGRRFYDALYFSLNTFTTVGYGDWIPSSEKFTIFKIKIISFRFLAVLEGLFGWLLMALFLITMGRTYLFN